MKSKISWFSMLCVLSVTPAIAGWQYDGYYIDDGYYVDDGSRFIVSMRGGLSYARAKIQNEIGSLDGYYYYNETTGAVVSETAYEAAGSPPGWDPVTGNLSALPAKKDFAKISFAAGGSIGFTMPYHPSWRLEAGYDHISEMDYNQIPLFEGVLQLSNGVNANIASSGVASTISTDVFSAMAYYDFFSGDKKPMNEFIPYVGFGVGYASSRTTLKLSDIYGDLSTDSDLLNYGTLEDGVLHFESPTDKSKYPISSNIAVVGAVGASYGIGQYMFLDLSARLMYIPKITWQLVNQDATLQRDWFSAKDMVYTTLMVGLRFEF